MIRINRPSQPPKKQRKRKSAKKSFKYNEDYIVAELWKIQYEKCCYCENKIPIKGHLKNVEHIVPKAIVRKLTNEWSNLLLACAQCNGTKSDKFPLELFKMNDPEVTVIYLKKGKDLKKGEPLLIDPSKEDPEEYLDFICNLDNTLFGLIKTKNQSKKGDFSIKTIGLYDKYYTDIHRDYLRDKLYVLFNSLTKAKDNNDGDTIELRKSEFKQIMKSNYKLTGLARSFVCNIIDETYGIEIPDL